jgi:hypothetical protein
LKEKKMALAPRKSPSAGPAKHPESVQERERSTKKKMKHKEWMVRIQCYLWRGRISLSPSLSSVEKVYFTPSTMGVDYLTP